MDLDLRQLEVFCRVVERASFTRAAADVHLSQAAVSERVAGLETQVGVPLLDRLGRRVEPTPIGRRLYERALELLRLRDDVRIELSELAGGRGGTLCIGASTIPGEWLLPGLVARFYAQRPDAFVRVVVSDTDDVVERVQRGDVELGLIGSEAASTSLVCEPIAPDELVLVASPTHPRAGGRPLDVADLASEAFVLREAGSGTRRALERHLGGVAGLARLRVVAELGSTTAVKGAVMAGLGVSIVSTLAVRHELESGALVALELDPPLPRRLLYAVRDRRRVESPLAREFRRLLEG